MHKVLTLCYNCTEHENPRLHVDVVFQHVLANSTIVDHREFVSHLKQDLSEAACIAR